MRRKRRNNNKKIIIISISLLLVMTVGYAAFETKLNITAKGNILPTIKIDDLKNLVITEGDGLYEDTYKEQRYVYKGRYPQNYIKLDNDMYRIMAIESDNTLKVIKEVSVSKRHYDAVYARKDSTYCIQSSYGDLGQNTDSKYGCNAWAATKDEYINGNLQGTVTKNASLNDYLNDEYFNTFSSATQRMITTHEFNIGSINDTNILGLISQEEKIKWSGKIGLLNLSDYKKANKIDNCNVTTQECANDNYLYEDILSLGDNKSCWIFGIYKNNSMILRNIYEGYLNASVPANDYHVYPVFYIDGDVLLSGNGSKESPYEPHLKI